MAKLSRFILNSDFPAEKQRPEVIKAKLDVSTQTLAPYSSRVFTANVNVPAGSFIENTYFKNTLDPGGCWVSAGGTQVVKQFANYDTFYTYTVMSRIDATTMQLQVAVYTSYNSGNVSVPAFTVEAKTYLSVSPFD